MANALKWRRGRTVRIAGIFAVGFLLTGCVRLLASEGILFDPPPKEETVIEETTGETPPGEATDESAEAAADDTARQNYEIIPAEGGVVGKPRRTLALATVGNGGDITLNFVDADIREVMKATLGAILNVNYTVAPVVQGAITVQSGRPISRAALLPTLESVLRLHGFAIVKEGNVFRIQPLQGAAKGNPAIRLGISGVAAGEGYGIQVVPLYYISAAKMAETLRPLAREGGVLHVDATRNIIIIGGTRFELAALLEAVEIFDVNWLAGMSFGLFKLDYADAQTMSGELNEALGSGNAGVAEGLVRLVPIKRMNAILAVSRQPRYLEQVRRWVERLDKAGGDGSGGGGRQLFIYFVQNGKAADLAKVLNEAFGGDSDTDAVQPLQETGEVAPGLEPVQITSTSGGTSGGDGGQTTTQPGTSTTESTPLPSTAGKNPVRFIADEERNAILISGSQSEYRAVMSVINQLDRRPLEVLIEVTIADVELTDRLEYGVRWFFQTDSGSRSLSQGLVGPPPVSATPTLGLSYTYSVTNAAAVIDLLSSITDVEVISAPQLMVLNNQEALLQVGDQVPFQTGQTETSGGGDSSSFTLLDTGVILRVTPRVNQGGLVLMDIEQEVSSASLDAAAAFITPTISKRNINTTVAVQSGQTIALGGLIKDSKANTKVGVPVLSKIPFIGALFRSTVDTITRNELLVLVTPRIVRDERGAFEATQELRRRIEDLERLEYKIAPKDDPEKDSKPE